MHSTGIVEVINMLQRYALDGVEFSVDTSTDAIGVLVPITERYCLEEFMASWHRLFEEPIGWRADLVTALVPRFIRCDFAREGWQALTFYGDMSLDLENEDVTPADLSVFCHSIRLKCKERWEFATYLDVKGVVLTRLRANVNCMASRLQFSDTARYRLATLCEQMAGLGWIQGLAITSGYPHIKLDVATNRLVETLQTINGWNTSDIVATARVRRAMRILGGAIGYASARTDAAGTVTWRVYARPFNCHNIIEILENLLA